MKTAAIILNNNLPVWTDGLYKSLKPYEREDYDLMVFDNGSKPEGVSQYTTFRSDENLFFGGGFHAGMQVVLEDDQYDSMLFLNNDLTIHPYNFVKQLREEMFGWLGDGFNGDTQKIIIENDIVSPCFYNVEPEGQCFWKTMHNWGQVARRNVPYIDFQCPMISKRLLKEIDTIDSDLMYGWGICFYLALECKKRNWNLSVLDRLCVLHHNSVTVKSGVAGIDIKEYCRLAEEGQYRFFNKNNILGDYYNLRKLAENYSYQP